MNVLPSFTPDLLPIQRQLPFSFCYSSTDAIVDYDREGNIVSRKTKKLLSLLLSEFIVHLTLEQNPNR